MDYLSYPVLDLRRRDDASAGPVEYARSLSILAAASGRKTIVDRTGTPRTTRPYVWSADGRAEIAELREFIAARKGSLHPVWVPTGNRDLVLTKDATLGDNTLTVKSTGYAKQLFMAGNFRRHLCVLGASGAVLSAHRVVDAVVAAAGSDVLVLETALPAPLPAGTALSYLVLCRLATDEVRIEYSSATVADAVLQFIELPQETP